MIDLPGDDTEARRIAAFVHASPTMRQVAEIARRAINGSATGAFNALLTHLSYAYGRGYVAGWRRGRAERGEVMPPPQV